MNYHHHVHRLSLIQPEHVNKILATNMEGIKSENPENLENINIIKLLSNELKLIDLKYSYFISTLLYQLNERTKKLIILNKY